MDCDNKIKCTCTYTSCSRYAKCCECIAYHSKKSEAPACLFSKEAERTYDRSIKNLYHDHQKQI